MAYKTFKTPMERQMQAKLAAGTNAAETIGEFDDPRLNDAQRTLGLMLADYRGRHPQLDTNTARDMQTMVRDFRETCKRKGITMPKLCLVYFVRMNHICVWPQDMEQAELQKRVHMFIVHRQRHGLPVDADDIAMGVRRAYPDYSLSRSTLVLPQSFKSNQQESMQ